MKARTSLGWAWRPTSGVTSALKRGSEKIRIGELREHHRIMGTTMPEEEETKMAKKVTTKKTPVSKKKTAVKKADKAKTDDGRIPLKRICGQLGIEPRLARRKLRNAELSFHDSRDRWAFTAAQAEKVKEVLRA